MRFWLTLTFLLSYLGIFSQSKSLEKADHLFAMTAYPAAIEAYEKVLSDEPTNTYAATRLADCYRLTNDFRSAFRCYAKAVKMKNVDAETYFHFGEILMINRKYQEAIPWLEKYQKLAPEDDRVAEMLSSCQNLEEFAASKSLFLVRRLTVNSELSDFGPAFMGNSVIFASSRKRTLVKYNRTGDSYLDFYVADYAGKPELGEPRLFRGATNTPFHEANACLTADQKEMYFTRNLVTKGKSEAGKSEVTQLALYHSTFNGDKWEVGQKLPFSDTEYSCGHPAISLDGKTLYFVSNMPGGFGGTDLYVVVKNGENWGKPENLGQDINTKGNEMFPWLDETGALFFASNGRGGLGALDIFQVDPNAKEIGNPINLGAPINSPYDDFGFIMDSKNGVGFFTSNRLGGQGDDDLYAVIKLVGLEGTVVDSAGNPVSDVLIDLREGRSRTQITSDEQGKFRLGIKSNGIYTLFLKKAGFQDQKIEFKESSTFTTTPQTYILQGALPSR